MLMRVSKGAKSPIIKVSSGRRVPAELVLGPLIEKWIWYGPRLAVTLP